MALPELIVVQQPEEAFGGRGRRRWSRRLSQQCSVAIGIGPLPFVTVKASTFAHLATLIRTAPANSVQFEGSLLL